MDNFANRLSKIRKNNGMTQNDIAEKLNVSFQAVSLWERGETTPDIDKLIELAKLFDVSLDWFLLGKEEKQVMMDFDEPSTGRLFNENRMYTYVKTYATVKGMKQTLKALPFAREKHEGQFRRGKDKIPYIYHPLLIACHCLSMGIDDDDVIATALLHDVCEDCSVLPQDLPVGEAVKEAVILLTKTSEYDKHNKESVEMYYENIKKNPTALLIKVLDRCNNVSVISGGFSSEKIVEYINETEKYFFPMMQYAKHEYPEYSNIMFIIKYHLSSVIESVKHMMK